MSSAPGQSAPGQVSSDATASAYYGHAAGTDDMRWAHITWDFLHGMSFYIDEFENDDLEAQQAFQSMISGLTSYLPCTWCRKHLAKHISENPMPTPSKYESDAWPNARWCVDLHNAVNKRQHKSIVPFDQVKARYIKTAKPSCPPQFSESKTDERLYSSNKDPVTVVTISVAVIVIFFIILAFSLQIASLLRRT